MREAIAVPGDLLWPISRVLEEAVQRIDGLHADQVMVMAAARSPAT